MHMVCLYFVQTSTVLSTRVWLHPCQISRLSLFVFSFYCVHISIYAVAGAVRCLYATERITKIQTRRKKNERNIEFISLDNLCFGKRHIVSIEFSIINKMISISARRRTYIKHNSYQLLWTALIINFWHIKRIMQRVEKGLATSDNCMATKNSRWRKWS